MYYLHYAAECTACTRSNDEKLSELRERNRRIFVPSSPPAKTAEKPRQQSDRHVTYCKSDKERNLNGNIQALKATELKKQK